jgi:hypothetical protein
MRAERIADGVHWVLKGYVNADVIESDDGLILDRDGGILIAGDAAGASGPKAGPPVGASSACSPKTWTRPCARSTSWRSSTSRSR